jgi:hypothetical protein
MQLISLISDVKRLRGNFLRVADNRVWGDYIGLRRKKTGRNT